MGSDEYRISFVAIYYSGTEFVLSTKNAEKRNHDQASSPLIGGRQ